jgi:hypothetical protein
VPGAYRLLGNLLSAGQNREIGGGQMQAPKP